MKRRSWILGLILIGGLWGLFNLNFGPTGSSRTIQKTSNSDLAIKKEASVSEQQKEAPETVHKAAFESEFRLEASLIGQVDANPEATHQRLKSWALLLAKEDLIKLKKMALDPQAPQDDRALAVYLLSLSNRDDAVTSLGEISRNPIPDIQNPRLKEYELTLRMQAIEGLERPQQKELSIAELQKTIQTSSEMWLVDRSHRIVGTLDGQNESPRIQDERALEKLLRKSAE